MYEIYCKLRDERGVKDSEVARKTNITKSTFSDWKNGRSVPGTEKLIKISEYFGVNVEYLKTGKEPSTEKPPIPNYDSDTLEMIKLFSQLNKEQKNSILSMMRSFALTN